MVKYNFKWSSPLTKISSVDYQLVHHAMWSSCTIEDIHRLHLSKGYKGVAYNLFIDKEGIEHEGRPEWASDADAFGYNHNSLSICLEGDFTREKIGPKQRETLIRRLVKNALKYPGIKTMRHMDVNETSCPGDIGWADILREVDERLREIKEENKQKKYATVEEVEQLRKDIELLASKINSISSSFKGFTESIDRKMKRNNWNK